MLSLTVNEADTTRKVSTDCDVWDEASPYYHSSYFLGLLNYLALDSSWRLMGCTDLACVVSFLFKIRQLTIIQTIKKAGNGGGGLWRKCLYIIESSKDKNGKMEKGNMNIKHLEEGEVENKWAKSSLFVLRCLAILSQADEWRRRG